MKREEAIKRLKEYAQYSYGIWHNDEEDTKAFDMAIEALQTDLVRCKDCRHRYMDGEITHFYWCRINERSVDDDDFCAWGERKGGEDE